MGILGCCYWEENTICKWRDHGGTAILIADRNSLDFQSCISFRYHP